MDAKCVKIYIDRTTTMNENAFGFKHLTWLLTRYQEPNAFERAFSITSEQFVKHIGQNFLQARMKSEQIRNVAEAFIRLEKSDNGNVWRENFTKEKMLVSLNEFVFNQIVRLILIPGELSGETISAINTSQILNSNEWYKDIKRATDGNAYSVPGPIQMDNFQPQHTFVVTRNNEKWLIDTRKKFKAIVESPNQTTQRYFLKDFAPHVMTFHFLYWLLLDYPAPEKFAQKIYILRSCFLNLIDSETADMTDEMLHNILLAMWRLQQIETPPQHWPINYAQCLE